MEEDYYTHKFSGTGCQPNGTEVGAGGFTDFSNSSGSSIQTLWGHGGTPKPAHRPAQGAFFILLLKYDYILHLFI
jgi:hypothetical protein